MQNYYIILDIEVYFLCPDILGPTKQTDETICAIKDTSVAFRAVMTITGFNPGRASRAIKMNQNEC